MKQKFAKILLCLFLFQWGGRIVFAEQDQQLFTDVDERHPYFTAITSLAETGILNGYEDGSFLPDKKVTRAEALKIILLAAGDEVPAIRNKAGFSDVESHGWYSPFVLRAKNLGIVNGNADGTFTPQRTVNLAECLKMIFNTNELVIYLSVEEDPYPTVVHTEWYARYFEYAKRNDLLKFLPDDELFPMQEMSRGELAELIYRTNRHLQNKEETTYYASYYGDQFQGRNTSSGEPYDKNKFTAAHRNYPFGTLVKVTNPDNGKSVIVKINDRGPYHEDRILDLSGAAFESIASLSSGIAPVTLERLPLPVGNYDSGVICSEELSSDFIKTNAFDNLTLDRELPTLFTLNELYLINGQVQEEGVWEVQAFLNATDGSQYPFSAEVDETGRFSAPLFLAMEGDFQIGLITGEEGVSKIYPIKVIKPCQTQEDLSGWTNEASQIGIDVTKNLAYLSWTGEAQLTKMIFLQNDQIAEILINNFENKVPIPEMLLENFQAGETYLQLATAQSLSPLSIDQSTIWRYSEPIKFELQEHRPFLSNEDQITVANWPTIFTPHSTVNIQTEVDAELKDKFYLIKPDGAIDSFDLGLTDQPEQFSLTLNVPVEEAGTYTLSLYNQEGEAILIYPLYVGYEDYPLLPNPIDLYSKADQAAELTELPDLREELIRLINRDREQNGVLPVVFNDKLNELAQARAEDMAEKNYYSHYTPDGKTVNDLKDEYQIKSFLSENLAVDVDIELAEYSLMLSGLHRTNITHPNWDEVGLGVMRYGEKNIVVVQIFSESWITEDNLEQKRTEIFESVNKLRSLAETKVLENNLQLQNIAQEWSDRMVAQGFTGPEDVQGQSINDYLQEQEIEHEVLSLFIGVDSLSELTSFLQSKDEITEEGWTNAGVGLTQNNKGQIKLTLLYGR